MTKEKNAVRTFTILYTLPSNRMFVHRFTTDKPVMAELKYAWLTSDIAKDVLGVEILSSSFDEEISYA
jgi:hypothetical protein